MSTDGKAEINDACWTSPTKKITSDIRLSSLSGNKAGATGQLNYRALEGTFSALCNRINSPADYSVMTHYIDFGSTIQPSTVNPGWYRLTDDLDIKISTSTMFGEVFLPVGPNDGLWGLTLPPVGCSECLVDGFAVASTGVIHIKLRRDVIGGALVVPGDLKLFTAYRVGGHNPPKPSNPILELYTVPSGSVIPVPTVCEINGGNVINVDFGVIPEDRIGTSVEQELNPKSINLAVACNTNLTQGASVRLVSDRTSFSDKLIRSSDSNLGIAMRQNGIVIAPFGSFPFQLRNGKANEQITLSLVRNTSGQLQKGQFTASATLIIESL